MSSSGEQLRRLLKAADANTEAAAAAEGDELKAKLYPDTVVNRAKAYFDAVMKGTDSVDALSHTPWRIIHVFDPELFKTVALENHGNVAGLLFAIFLAVFNYHERITEIEDHAREHKDDAYILKQLANEKSRTNGKLETNKESKANETFNQALIEQVKQDLQSIANELFPGQNITIILTGDNLSNIQFELRSTTPTTAELKTNNELSFLKKLQQKLLLWIPEAVSNFWTLLSSYAMFYWIVWMTAILMAGAALTPALGFGLPAILPALFLLWKATEWIYNYRHPITPKTQAEMNTQFNKLLLFRSLCRKITSRPSKEKLRRKV